MDWITGMTEALKLSRDFRAHIKIAIGFCVATIVFLAMGERPAAFMMFGLAVVFGIFAWRCHHAGWQLDLNEHLDASRLDRDAL